MRVWSWRGVSCLSLGRFGFGHFIRCCFGIGGDRWVCWGKFLFVLIIIFSYIAYISKVFVLLTISQTSWDISSTRGKF